MNNAFEFTPPTDEEVSVVRGWLRLQKFWRDNGHSTRVNQYISDSEVHMARAVKEEAAPIAEHKLFAR